MPHPSALEIEAFAWSTLSTGNQASPSSVRPYLMAIFGLFGTSRATAVTQVTAATHHRQAK